jgi:hypothetical protein
VERSPDVSGVRSSAGMAGDAAWEEAEAQADRDWWAAKPSSQSAACSQLVAEDYCTVQFATFDAGSLHVHDGIVEPACML